MAIRKFDHEILVLQGGGALGAFQSGVYEGLAETGRDPTWVVGVSIGAITTALIAGNPREKRVERLHAFWDRVSSYAPFILPTGFEAMRPIMNKMSAASVASFGSPGFFTLRMPPPSMCPDGTLAATSYCDTSPLKSTLEELVDFDLINSKKVRVSLGAVNVRTGASVYFDNHKIRIKPEHVMASGALPPGFPAVEIDGEHYWDGGIVSNSPLNYVWDEKPLTTALIVMVDLFNAKGDLPLNLDQVGERQKDITYASKQRFSVQRTKELGDLRKSLTDLLAKLPANLKNGPEARKLATLCDDRQWLIARLTNPRLQYGSQTKDFEFSRATVHDHWAAGLEGVRKAIANRDGMEPSMLVPGVSFYDLGN
ncbi:MAG: patatin-like phospholipase family protein [Rhodoferax sp.]